MAAYKSEWWYPNHVEYGAGLNQPKTWPNVKEQYRRPDIIFDQRHYDLPVEGTSAHLYYEMPRLGRPQYRATFRDKPCAMQRYYPDADPLGKPKGYFGRMYYEDGPPQFKYDGPKKNEQYWLERSPYLPSFTSSQASAGPPHERDNSLRDINVAHSSRPAVFSAELVSRGGNTPPSMPSSSGPVRSRAPVRRPYCPPAVDSAQSVYATVYSTSYSHPKRSTQDGVGFM